MFRTIVFFGPITPVFAGESLDPLVSASRGFSTAIQQQILAIQPGPSLIEFVAKTIVYADAKAAYFNAVREAAPELMNIATGREVLSSGESGPNYEYWSYTRLPNRVFRSVIEQRTLENCRLAGGTNQK